MSKHRKRSEAMLQDLAGIFVKHREAGRHIDDDEIVAIMAGFLATVALSFEGKEPSFMIFAIASQAGEALPAIAEALVDQGLTGFEAARLN